MITNNLKRKVKSEIRSIATDAVMTPVTLKYVPFHPGQDDVTIPPADPGVMRDKAGLPIPPQDLWIGYGSTPAEHLATGAEHVASMRKLLAADGYTIAAGHRVLDFGCGAGRMLRHFANEANDAEFWGSEIDAKFTAWTMQYLSPPFRFITNTTIPHLPFADGYFDLIYAGSVFTHIVDLAPMWLLEMRRILSPRGRAFLTFHDDHTREVLRGKWSSASLAKRANAITDKFDVLAMDRWPEYGGSIVFYSDAWLSRTLDSMFSRRVMRPEAYGYQSAAILTK